MTCSVLINEKRNEINEINLDISPEKYEIFKILKGKASFVGQWPEQDVVILKCDESPFDLQVNENRLPRPFTNMIIMGKILLIRMNEYSEPLDFTLQEYHEMTKKSHPITRSSISLISRPLSRNMSYSS
jgi:hypothetical protein|tara:strand:- start:59 stop:445 length:387 start_codon:yes stop_codon:yes gene_type:complete